MSEELQRNDEMPGKRAPFVVFGGILLIAICTVTVAIIGYIRGGGEFLSPEPAREIVPGTGVYKDHIGD